MLIGHYRRTSIACAPAIYADIFNKYTDAQHYVFGPKDTQKIVKPDTTLVHLHNKYIGNHDKQIIQYHSEPFRVDLSVPDNVIPCVISQYHAILPEYQHCRLVRNPVDIYSDEYVPQYVDDKIRIGYSASTPKASSGWADKGYREMKPLLHRLKRRYKGKIEVDIIVGVPLAECLKRKARCNLFIGEVKTTSYHRTGLESLGMGIATICRIGGKVEDALFKSSGASCNPFINVDLSHLPKKLDELIDRGVDNLLSIGKNSRQWMEEHWCPKTISQEYVTLYSEALENTKQ
tara:strand:+ start:1975 stop:2844 length:870 start_codon:yes stop_codon:yes gene_type:complete